MVKIAIRRKVPRTEEATRHQAKAAKAIALFFADAHLDRAIWPKRREITGDSRIALDQILQAALSHEVDTIVSAGDLLDSADPDTETVRHLHRWLEKVNDHGMTFRFIQGNHDRRDPPWPTALNVNALHINGCTCTIGPFTAVGLDYQPIDKLAAAVKDLPQSDIYICHQAWKEIKGAGHSADTVKLFPNGSTVFSGDTHKTTTVKVGKRTLISPGATHMRAIDEPTEHSYSLLMADGSWRTQKLQSRKVYRQSVDSESQLEHFILATRQEIVETPEDVYPVSIQRPLVIVRYNSGLERVGSRVKEALGELAHCIVKPQPEHADIRDVESGEVEVRGDLSEYVSLRFPEGDRHNKMLTSLMVAGDKKQAVEELRRQYEL